jgi:hypothetical protein
MMTLASAGQPGRPATGQHAHCGAHRRSSVSLSSRRTVSVRRNTTDRSDTERVCRALIRPLRAAAHPWRSLSTAAGGSGEKGGGSRIGGKSGGTMSLRSEPGVCSTFTVDLPPRGAKILRVSSRFQPSK